MVTDAFTSELVGAQRAHLIQSTEILQGKALLAFNSLLGYRESTSTQIINSHAQSKQTFHCVHSGMFEFVGDLKRQEMRLSTPVPEVSMLTATLRN